MPALACGNALREGALLDSGPRFGGGFLLRRHGAAGAGRPGQGTQNAT